VVGRVELGKHDIPTPLRYVFRIPIFLSSAREKKSLIWVTLSVSVSYCFATEGSVWELTSEDLSWSGILSCVEIENCLEDCKRVNVDVNRAASLGVDLVEAARVAERTSTRGADMMEQNYVKSGAGQQTTLTPSQAV
jgi:hypothetical protein